MLGPISAICDWVHKWRSRAAARWHLGHIPDRIAYFCARKAPKRLAYWCTVEVWSHATTGPYGHEEADAVTPAQMIERYWADHRLGDGLAPRPRRPTYTGLFITSIDTETGELHMWDGGKWRIFRRRPGVQNQDTPN